MIVINTGKRKKQQTKQNKVNPVRILFLCFSADENGKGNDQENRRSLEELGWRVITIWECELKKKNRDVRLAEVITEIKSQNKEI